MTNPLDAEADQLFRDSCKPGLSIRDTAQIAIRTALEMRDAERAEVERLRTALKPFADFAVAVVEWEEHCFAQRSDLQEAIVIEHVTLKGDEKKVLQLKPVDFMDAKVALSAAQAQENRG